MKVHEVKLEYLKHVSMEEFSEFGRIVGRDEDKVKGKFNLHPITPEAIRDCDVVTKAYWDILPFKDTGERFSLGVIFMKPKPEGTIFEWTECHLETYEWFFPLGGKELIFLLAPKGPIPDPKKTRAFLFGPDEGVMLDKGTWHYPPFTPSGVTPTLMPRYGHLAEVTGSVTEAFGTKYDTPLTIYRKGALHALNTKYYGKGFGGEYNIRLV